MPFEAQHLMKVPTLSSAAVAILGWFLTFIGICILGAKDVIGFELFYLLVTIIGVLLAIAFSQTREHRIAIVAFVAIGFNFLVGLADAGVKLASVSTGFGLVAAGTIFMSFTFVYWIFVFGSGETSPVTLLVENGQGFALPAISMPKVSVPSFGKKEASVDQIVVVPGNAAPVSAAASSPYGQATFPSYPPPNTATPPPPVPQSNVPTVIGTARALYSYTASPSDPNEISFTKGQLLEVLDNKGKWWQARYTNENGQVVVGIAPSNYLQQL